MSVHKCRRLLILFSKMLTAAGIATCLMYPTPIFREELKHDGQEGFKITFTEITFSVEHHFCAMPEARAVMVKSEEIFNALNLPNGTQFNKDLEKFGECRAKLTKLEKDLTLCFCQQFTFYLVITLAAIVSTVFQLCEIILSLWKKTNVDCSVLACVSAVTWLLLACLATTYHTIWYEDIWLPDALFGQSYFQRPVAWSVAIGGCYVYFSLSVLEFILFSPKKTDRNCKCGAVSRSDQTKSEGGEADDQELTIHDDDDDYDQFIRSKLYLHFHEPLPQPKLANSELVPPKLRTCETWP